MALGDGKAKKELNEINQEVAFLLDAVSSIGDKLVASLKRGEEGAEDISTILKKGIIKDTNQAVRNTEEFVKIQLKAEKGALKRSEIAKLQSKLEENQNQLAVKKEVLELQDGKVSKKLLTTLEDQVGEQEKIFDKLKESNVENAKTLDLTDLISKGAEGFLNNIDKSGTLSKVLTGELTKSQKQVLIAQAAFAIIGALTLQASTNINDVQKQLGVAYSSALGIQASFGSISYSRMLHYQERDRDCVRIGPMTHASVTEFYPKDSRTSTHLRGEAELANCCKGSRGRMYVC